VEGIIHILKDREARDGDDGRSVLGNPARQVTTNFHNEQTIKLLHLII
jgi:hypothetical protein